jgi:hypothetical protein
MTAVGLRIVLRAPHSPSRFSHSFSLRVIGASWCKRFSMGCFYTYSDCPGPSATCYHSAATEVSASVLAIGAAGLGGDVAARRLFAWRGPAALGAYRVVSSRTRCRLERERSRVHRRVGNRARTPLPRRRARPTHPRSCPGPPRLRCGVASAGRYLPSADNAKGGQRPFARRRQARRTWRTAVIRSCAEARADPRLSHFWGDGTVNGRGTVHGQRQV